MAKNHILSYSFIAGLAVLCTGCSPSVSQEQNFIQQPQPQPYPIPINQQPPVMPVSPVPPVVPTAEPRASSFEGFVESLRMRALREGITTATWNKAVPYMRFNEKLIALDRKQSEGFKTFEAYRSGVLTAKKIDEGNSLKAQYREHLQKTSAQTGVPAGIILALWGMESNYGKNMGSTHLMESLSTLAYDGRRSEYFQKELLNALHIVQMTPHVDIKSMKGSWAGAMGQCQFMPKSYLTYAVDGDGDGEKDIWTNKVDVISSVASYLKTEKWRAGEPASLAVELPQNLTREALEQMPAQSVAQWKAMGVRITETEPSNINNLSAKIKVPPRSEPDKVYMIFHNHDVIMHWNKSTLFALTVSDLAKRLERF